MSVYYIIYIIYILLYIYILYYLNAYYIDINGGSNMENIHEYPTLDRGTHEFDQKLQTFLTLGT